MLFCVLRTVVYSTIMIQYDTTVVLHCTLSGWGGEGGGVLIDNYTRHGHQPFTSAAPLQYNAGKDRRAGVSADPGGA